MGQPLIQAATVVDVSHSGWDRNSVTDRHRARCRGADRGVGVTIGPRSAALATLTRRLDDARPFSIGFPGATDFDELRP